MQGKIKIIRRAAVVIIIGVILIITGLLVFMKTDPAGRTVLKLLNDRIPGTVGFDRHQFSYTKGRIGLTNVRITGSSHTPFITADRVLLDVSLSALRRGKLVIETMELDRPRAFVTVMPDGKLNLASVFPETDTDTDPSPPGPVTKTGKRSTRGVMLENLIVRNGSVMFRHTPLQISVEANRVDIDGKMDTLNKALQGTLTVSYGHVQTSVISSEYKDALIGFSLDGDRLSIDRATLDVNDTLLTASGRIDRISDKPVADLEVKAEGSVQSVLDIFQKTSTVTGDAKVTVRINGELNNPDTDLSVSYGGGRFGENRLPSVTLSAEVRDRRLTADIEAMEESSGLVTLAGDVDLANVFSEGILGKTRNWEQLTYDLNITGRGLTPSSLPLPFKAPNGKIDADIHLKGRKISPENLVMRAEGVVTGKRLRMKGQTAAVDLKLDFDAGVLGRQITVEKLNGNIGDVSISAKGNIDAAGKTFSADTRMDAPDLASALIPLGITDITGNLDLDAKATGSFYNPEVDIHAGGNRLKFRDITLGDIQLTGNYSRDRGIVIESLDIENRGSRISGKGRLPAGKAGQPPKVSTEKKGLDLVFSNLEAADFMPNPPVRGAFNGMLNLTGSLNALSGDLALTGENVSAFDRMLGDISTRIALAPGLLTVHDLVTDHRRSGIRADGQIELVPGSPFSVPEDPEFKLKLRGKRLDLKSVFPKWSGSAAVSADFSGTLNHPSGPFHVSGENAVVSGQKIAAVDIRGRYGDKRFYLEPLIGKIGAGDRVEARGWIGLDGAYHGDVIIENIQYTDIWKLGEQDLLDARLSLNAKAQGSFSRPKITGELTWKEARIKGKPVQEAALDVDLDSKKIAASGNVGDLFLDGFYGWNGDYALDVKGDNTDLSPWLLLGGVTDLNGRFTGRVFAKGTVKDIDKTEGNADIKALFLAKDDLTLMETSPFTMSFGKGRLSVKDLSAVILDEGALNVTGQAGLSGALSLTGKMDLPFSRIERVTDAITETRGNLSLDISVTGAAESPRITGELSLHDIGFQAPVIFDAFRSVNGRLHITPDKVQINDISGRLGKGRFNLSGNIDLADFKPENADVRLEADSLPVVIPDVLDGLVSAGLSLSGTEDAPRLTGDVMVLDGLWTKPVNMSLININNLNRKGEKKRKSPVKSPAAEFQHPFLKNLALDVTVKRRNPFIVDNNLALLEITPDLTVRGGPADPVVNGRVTVDEGEVLYHANRFDVTRGFIDLTNPYKTEPILDIAAETVVRKWTITLAVEGPPDELEFTLSSDPEETDEDILSLLLVGRTTGEMIEAEGGNAVSPARVLTALISSQYGEDIRKRTGLDIVEAENVADEDSGDDDGIRVTLGKNLTKRLTVKYAFESRQGEMVQRAIAEYKFFENVLLTGFQENTGVYGGALKYRIEFR